MTTTSPFTNALAQGLALRRTMAAVSVSYSDGTNAGSVPAVRGKPNVRTADALVAQMTERYTDWMIAAADLENVAPALSLPPSSGDTITIDGDTYTVAHFEGGPAWEYVDPAESEYRIHTIKTGDA